MIIVVRPFIIILFYFICRWFHVSTNMNPADCVSRGLRPGELAQHDHYRSGPAFLRQFGESWSPEVNLIPLEQLPGSYVVETTRPLSGSCAFPR